ncbi:glycolate oxidase FAD binding subunit [Burkholderiaceae bacterium]|nr:glycolate oxidase FAD binding subunit [Burkholderiaceae bacterium]
MQPTEPALRRLIDHVLTARDAKAALDIRGTGSKAFYGGSPRGEPLSLAALAGITSHEPTELVVTARAATPLAELEAALAEHGQCLAFEPPRFADPSSGVAGGTVGGMVAAGLAGPARVSAGSVRDYVLGATLLDGQGQLLRFGGQVMKNVAGYDVSRLLAGSLGVLGVICEVSLKVLPRAPSSTTLAFDCDETQALELLARWAGQPLPVSASAWHAGRFTLRLAGAHAAVSAAARRLGGTALDAGAAAAWWDDLRDQRHAFFRLADAELAAGVSLWRLSVPDTAPPIALRGEQFIEWGGAQRWWRSGEPAERVRAAAEQAGGHATLFRAADRSAGAFAPLAPPLLRIHRGLKQAFDPAGVFNPDRLYPGL